jgi:fluoride exporter
VSAAGQTRWKAPRLYAAVALGSGLGGSLRWLVALLAEGWLGAVFPWGTVFVNATGSLLIGLYAALVAPEGRFLAGPLQRHFVMAGICGGYTTFSIFSLEALQLFHAAQWATAGLLIVISLFTWLAAVWAGYALGVRLSRPRRS